MSGALLIHLNLGVDKDLNDPMQNGEPRDLLVVLRNITHTHESTRAVELRKRS
jgi:hypothetical protein